MEGSAGKSEVPDVSTKSRSLDLKSIYGEISRGSVGKSKADSRGSGTSQESKALKRKLVPLIDNGGSGLESRRKRSRRVSLSSFDPVIRRRRNGRSRLNSNGFVSGIGKQKKPSSSCGAPHNLCGLDDNLHNSDTALALPLVNKDGDQALCVGNSKISNCLDVTVTIPRRPRGMSRRKRSDISLKRARSTSACSGKTCGDDETSKFFVNCVAPSRASIVKQNENVDVGKEIGSSRVNSDRSTKDANGTSVKTSRRKMRSRKLQVSTIVTQTHGENEARLDEAGPKSCEDFLDDDEENLEQNAARMLSSRFDPRCISGNKMTSPKPTNRSSSQLFRERFKGSNVDVSSVHAESRALRPRKHYGKGFFRKRRHFYEVHYSDMDPYWVIKQRIRVFWPLDQNWYFGLVKDYDPVTKLHHIKYDDREEEWVNLQNERFKLLLFPSEVRFNSERSGMKVIKKNEKGDKNTTDGNCIGNIIESETIISWLTRSNHPLKSSPVSIQKQRRNHLLKEFEPSILSASKGNMLTSPSRMISEKLSSSCNVKEKLIEIRMPREPMMQTNYGSDGRKLSFVYFRKRFRSSRERLNDKPEGNSASLSSTGPISFLASVANRESIPEELYFNVIPTKLKQIILKVSLPDQCIHQHGFGSELFLLFRSLLFCHGKLMHLRTMVRMEVIFVDSALGLRFFSFEGCLRWAVTLICLIMRTFYQNKNCNYLKKRQVPYTSIGFKLSGLHDQRGLFLFTLYNFMKMESAKWRYLENKLKRHSISRRELLVEDCTYVNIKDISSRRDQILCTSILEGPVSLEGLNMDPGPCNFDEKCGMHPLRAHSSASAPPFSLSMHLKLLMENNADAISFQKPNSTFSLDCPENYEKFTGEGCSLVEDFPGQVSKNTNEKFESSFSQAPASPGWLSYSHLKVKTGAFSMSNDGDWVRSSHNFLNGKVNMTGIPEAHDDAGRNSSDETFERFNRFSCRTKSRQGVEKPCSPFHKYSSYPEKIEAGCSYSLNTTDVRTQLFTPLEERLSDRARRGANYATDFVWEMNERICRSPNTAAPRSIWHRNRHKSVSPTFGQCSELWPEDFIRNGFFQASRKPRTQVSYSFPAGDCDLDSKYRSHHKKGRFYKKMKTDNAKSISGGSERPESYLESLICYANVLVTVGDRGWRECGAQVILDSDDQKDWRILVKLSGATKYVHKAHQFLQPGATNRYTHAMMWKGGKDWTLEFTDRSQWSLFKVVHEECFNRNVRSASVKNIPIPGVRLIDDSDESIVEAPFIRNSSKYYQQVGTEVDMALDPSYVLYDMDSGDEEWISNFKKSVDIIAEVTEDMFERAMDMFEKVAYAKHCDRFTSDEIEEFMTDFGPLDVTKAIHEHWWQKRQKKDLPLIRQFQPALWEHYLQQLKEWELTMSKMTSSSDGCQEKACLLEKPPMFAFCLRPRGLEVPNKGSKQKSHRKLMFTGHHNSFTREHDGLHAYGRKFNGFSVGEEKAPFAGTNHEFSSHLLQSPSSSDGSDRNIYAKLYRNNSRKNRMFSSPRDSQMSPKFSYNETSKRHGVHCWGSDMCEWSSKTKQSQLDGFQRPRTDINEFKLRDASSAAQHASNMAKLKKEKAQWLLHKADLALQKATVALMTAEAIKSSQKDWIGDG